MLRQDPASPYHFTAYHARFFAHDITRRGAVGSDDRLSMSLFDACVDLNPHQIEAALFALRSPLSKGMLLADEVGLGKTVEAGLVLCQFWAERRRRLLVICPASLRKQWSSELSEKFNLSSLILDARSYREAKANGSSNPFETAQVGTGHVVIASMNFVSGQRGDVRAVPWDMVIIDEAHKLRNAYRESNVMGQNIRWALEDRFKVLLTATPLQNSLIELYGLSTLIDDHVFGDSASFRSQYMGRESDLVDLRARLKPLCKRTLRQQVLEYINYTERKAVTRPFRPSDEEHKLYEAISSFLMREDTYAIPHQQRHLTALIMRKLLASSSYAIAGTLETMKSRLENLRDGLPVEKKSLVELVIAGEEIEDEYLDEIQIGVEQQNRVDGQDNAANGAAPPYSSSGEQATPPAVDRAKLEAEITELTQYIRWARSIGIDAKTRTLLHALEIGYSEMAKMGANRKALIFTESRRTQQYVRDFLEANGYTGKIVLFNGTNSDAESRRIYDRWVEANAGTGRVTGSRPVDIRTALIEEFRDHAQIMIATEAAAEGVNLQFCSLVVNYDLPWNPQRIEQRIGRCHRYGQKHDVVVINFLNERNEADRRVMELLEEKFRLFNGVFGASDDVLGTIESGVDFEKRILEIYQQCRSPEQIEAAFAQLQQEMEQSIKARLEATRELLLEHFDEDVHDRLRGQLDTTRQRLDRVGQRFWQLTRFILDGQAAFDDESLCFDLWQPLPETIKPGRYHLISKTQPNVAGEFLYRLSHPLGEQVLQRGRKCSTPPAEVTFDITGHPTRISPVEALKGRYGWLTLQRLQIESFGLEEYLLFSAFDDAGRPIDAETCERLFACRAAVAPLDQVPAQAASQLEQEASRHAAATLSHSLEANNRFFQEERERLEKWADDMVAAAEKELADTKGQIKALNRQARVATSTNEQHELQSKVRDLERKQRQQRRRIFDVEDEISHKRDRLVELLEKRMAQKTQVESLFTIRWSVV